MSKAVTAKGLAPTLVPDAIRVGGQDNDESTHGPTKAQKEDMDAWEQAYERMRTIAGGGFPYSAMVELLIVIMEAIRMAGAALRIPGCARKDRVAEKAAEQVTTDTDMAEVQAEKTFDAITEAKHVRGLAKLMVNDREGMHHDLWHRVRPDVAAWMQKLSTSEAHELSKAEPSKIVLAVENLGRIPGVRTPADITAGAVPKAPTPDQVRAAEIEHRNHVRAAINAAKADGTLGKLEVGTASKELQSSGWAA